MSNKRYGVTLSDYTLKALKPRCDWPDKDELLDVVYWGKQALALAVGVIFGLTDMYGLFAILAYIGISSIVAHQYIVKYQEVDENELGGFWDLAKEGFGAAFATFMVAWITVYTSLHS